MKLITDAGGVGRAVRRPTSPTAPTPSGWSRTAVDAFGGLDALFNNAGTIRPGTAVKLSEEDWDLVLAVNVKSVFLGAKHAVPVMADARRRGDRVHGVGVRARPVTRPASPTARARRR